VTEEIAAGWSVSASAATVIGAGQPILVAASAWNA